MNVLVIDIGGTNVKILATGEAVPRRFPSGLGMTPEKMISGVKKLIGKWKFDAISIGYPGLVIRGRVASEPNNLAPGWIGFDFDSAFGHPVKILNDAAMQAMGSYKGGELLFLGLGTGLGSALIVDDVVVPLEVGHLAYKKGTYDDYFGNRGLKRFGRRKWRRHVMSGVARLIGVVHPDEVVLGGGNAKKLKKLLPGCRRGENAHAFIGGFRMWQEEDGKHKFSTPAKTRSR
ncbi:MAG: ROK family protein [Acidobacteria bacterium]|nr:ROK family protein [Acidobacteriota bacterium]